jgi:HEAT repeat protein
MLDRLNNGRRTAASLLLLAALAVALLGAPPPAAADDTLDKLQARALERYLKDLGSRSAETRRDAADGLGGYEEAQAVAALAGALSDEDSGVREAAAGSLWETGEAAAAARPALERVLTDPEPGVRVRAAGALEAMDVDPATLVEARRSVARDGDWFDQALAARDLIGHVPPAELVGPVLDSIRRTPEGSRSAFADPEDEFSGASVLEPLAGANDPAVTAGLAAALTDPAMPRVALVDALAPVEPEPDGWAPTLVGLSRDRDPELRRAVAEALELRAGRAGGASGWPDGVKHLLDDPDHDVRYAAVEALGAAGGEAAGAATKLAALSAPGPDESVRSAAVRALGEIGDAAEPFDRSVKAEVARVAGPALLAIVDAPGDEDLRRAAIDSYVQLAVEPSVAATELARIASGSYPDWVRITATRNIGKLGRDGQKSLPVLERLESDPESLISSAARSSREEILRGASTPPAPAPAAATARAGGDVAAAQAWLREHGREFTQDDFYRALVEADADAVTAFLEAGMSAGDAGTTGMPPLHHALMFACTYGVRPSSEAAHRIVAELLAHGADPNALDEMGNPALHRAAGTCDGGIIAKLITAGADVNAVNSTGLSAFSLVLALSDIEAAEAMLAGGFRYGSAEAALAREWYLDDPVRRRLIERAGGR